MSTNALAATVDIIGKYDMNKTGETLSAEITYYWYGYNASTKREHGSCTKPNEKLTFQRIKRPQVCLNNNLL